MNTFSYDLTLLPDDIIFNELLEKMGLYEFIDFCNTNKKYKTIYDKDLLWKNLYIKNYSDSKMDIILINDI